MFQRIDDIVMRDMDPDLRARIDELGNPAGAEIFARRVQDREIGLAISALLEVCPRDLAIAIATIVLDHFAAHMPGCDPYTPDLRDDARFWASVANAIELREYVSAACRQMVEDGAASSMAVGPRKALLVALWDSLPAADKRKFLARVDPKGVFRGAA